MYIYKTTNNVNGLVYVGQSSFPVNETADYLGSGKKLKEAIKNHGKESFTKEILQECNDYDELNAAEIYWIEFYDARNPLKGYNILKGGTYPNIGSIISEALNKPEELEKASKRNLKKWDDPNYRDKVTIANRKAWSNPDLIKRHSENQKERFKNPDYRESLKKAGQNMKTVTCPHCNKSGKLNHMNGKHFDNCIHHTDLEKRKLAIERHETIIKNTTKITCPHCLKTGAVGNMNRWHFDNCKLLITLDI